MLENAIPDESCAESHIGFEALEQMINFPQVLPSQLAELPVGSRVGKYTP